jgi:hypothetical protein
MSDDRYPSYWLQCHQLYFGLLIYTHLYIILYIMKGLKRKSVDNKYVKTKSSRKKYGRKSDQVDTLGYVRFQVLTAASMKMTAFWDIKPSCLVEIYRRFGRAYCLHHQGDGQVYMRDGLDTQLHHSPDDGYRDGPWNVGDF